MINDDLVEFGDALLKLDKARAELSRDTSKTANFKLLDWLNEVQSLNKKLTVLEKRRTPDDA